MKLARKWRMTIFWSAVGLVLADLIRRPLIVIWEHWHGDVYWTTLHTMLSEGHNSKTAMSFTTQGEKFSFLCGIISGIIIFFMGLILIGIILMLLLHSLCKFHKWAHRKD